MPIKIYFYNSSTADVYRYIDRYRYIYIDIILVDITDKKAN